jgi:drug/metabolite transporter (DMT)-like permease
LAHDGTFDIEPNMSDSKGGRTTAIVCLLGSTLCFGSVPIFLRRLTEYLDPFTVNGVRYLTAALFWLPFVIVLRRRGLREGTKVDRVWRDALIPLIPNLAGQILWAMCPYYVEASVIGFTIRLTFLFTIIFGFLLVAEERRLARSPLFYIGTLFCMGGVLAMYLAKALQSQEASAFGVGLVAVTAMCFGAYSVTVRRWLSHYPARLSFGVVSLYTSAGLLVVMFFFGDYGNLAALPGKGWAWLLVSAMLGIAFSHVFVYKAVHSIGPIVSSGMLMATPFVTYLGASIFLDEQMASAQFLGGLMVVIGGGLLVVTKARMSP